MPSNHLILCCPPSPPALNLSQHQDLFQWVGSLPSGQSFGASASSSVLPMNIQGWFPLGLTGLSSLLSKGFSRVFSSTTIKSINSWALNLLYGPTLTSVNDYWKNHSFDFYDLGWKLMPLLFNMLSSFVIAFLKEQVSFNFMAAITVHSDFGVQENKGASTFSPSICHEVMELASQVA